VVDIYRVDIAQKFQIKTNKKGEYFHIVPAFGEYVLAISCTGYAPLASIKIRVGGEPSDQSFTLIPGDGTVLSKEQAVQAAGNVGNPTVAPSAEDKKKQEEAAAEIAKKNAEITKQNEKIKADNESLRKHMEAAHNFNKNKDYENAVKEYKGALEVDDTQAPIYAELCQAYFNMGAVRFNKGTKEKNKALLDEALQMFNESAKYGEKAVKLGPTTVENFTIYGNTCFTLYDKLKVNDFAPKVIDVYTTGADLETDPAKKMDMLCKVAYTLYRTGDVEKANKNYEKVLSIDPNNTAALKGKALVICGTTFTNTTPEDKAKLEQAMAIFQQVKDKLQPGPELDEVNASIDYLQNTMKIEVKKGSDKGNKGNKKGK